MITYASNWKTDLGKHLTRNGPGQLLLAIACSAASALTTIGIKNLFSSKKSKKAEQEEYDRKEAEKKEAEIKIQIEIEKRKQRNDRRIARAGFVARIPNQLHNLSQQHHDFIKHSIALLSYSSTLLSSLMLLSRYQQSGSFDLSSHFNLFFSFLLAFSIPITFNPNALAQKLRAHHIQQLLRHSDELKLVSAEISGGSYDSEEEQDIVSKLSKIEDLESTGEKLRAIRQIKHNRFHTTHF